MTQRKINRAPVLTLWATVVARRVGFSDEEALTLGRAVSGLTAQSKGRRLGLYTKAPESEAAKVRAARENIDARELEFMGRRIPIVREGGEIRALSKASPIHPASVRRYLEGKFEDDLDAFTSHLQALADAYVADDLLAKAMDLYMGFRPTTPKGVEGWGKAGLFDTDVIDRLRAAAAGS